MKTLIQMFSWGSGGVVLTNRIRHSAWVGVLCSVNVWAQAPISLDAAVAEQLTFVGTVACANLLANGGQPVNNLGVFCSRQYPTDPGGGPGTGTPAAGGPSTPVSMKKQAAQAERDDMPLDEAWSLFLTLEQEDLARDPTPLEGGFEGSGARIQAGISFMPRADRVYSLALHQARQQGDFDSGGDFVHVNQGMQLIAGLQFPAGFSLDASVGLERVSSDRTRHSRYADFIFGFEMFVIEGTPNADYNHWRSGASLQLNHDWSEGAFNLQTQLGYDWLETDYGSYAETGDSGLELMFHDDILTSRQSRLGLLASFAISTGWGVILPQLSATWHHEFEEEGRTVDVSFVDDRNAARFDYQVEDADANFGQVGVGAVLVLKAGLQLFVFTQQMVEHAYFEHDIVSAGVRQAL